MRSLKNMLSVDFKRATAEKLFYISFGIAILMPILILVMTTSLSKDGSVSFTSVWQAIESPSGSSTGMDMMSMCNINLVYILNLVMVCIFISEEYRSGYVKNLFTNHADKASYALSKLIVGSLTGIISLLLYFLGAIIGGKIANLSFTISGANALNILCCMLSKCFFMVFMVGIAILVSVFGKSRLWLSILLGLAGSMLQFTMISMITPLDANIINVVLCFAGGLLFGALFVFLSQLLLKKIDII